MQDHDAPGWTYGFLPEQEMKAPIPLFFAWLLFGKINYENQRNFEWTLNFVQHKPAVHDLHFEVGFRYYSFPLKLHSTTVMIILELHNISIWYFYTRKVERTISSAVSRYEWSDPCISSDEIPNAYMFAYHTQNTWCDAGCNAPASVKYQVFPI